MIIYKSLFNYEGKNSKKEKFFLHKNAMLNHQTYSKCFANPDIACKHGER